MLAALRFSKASILALWMVFLLCPYRVFPIYLHIYDLISSYYTHTSQIGLVLLWPHFALIQSPYLQIHPHAEALRISFNIQILQELVQPITIDKAKNQQVFV